MSLFDVFRRQKQPSIFICYRRHGDGSGYGGRLADKLVKHFGPGRCFRDVENIEAGVDFVESIQKAITTCEVLVVVIGPDWATQADANDQPRIDDPNDFVRLEVATALQRDIRVMPVLVGGAQLPGEERLPDDLRALPRRQAHELTDTRWDYDTDRLIEAIESIGIKGSSPAAQEAARQKLKLALAITATLLVAVVVMLAVIRSIRLPLGPAEPAAHTEETQPPAEPLALEPTPPDPAPQEQAPAESSAEAGRQGQLEAELRAEQEKNRALEAERDRARLEAELEAERAKTREAERATQPPAETVPNIAGIWVDANNPNNGSQITQNGHSFDFRRWGYLPNGTKFESTGRGTIDAGLITSYYNATYQTGIASVGDCSGVLSADGRRLDLTCRDSLLGTFPLTSIRQ